MQETMKWINCWRAGVMSRHEEEEEEGLLTLVDSKLLKVYLSTRTTLVREGMSACEERVIGSTLQSDVIHIHECMADSGSHE